MTIRGHPRIGKHLEQIGHRFVEEFVVSDLVRNAHHRRTSRLGYPALQLPRKITHRVRQDTARL